MADPLVHLQDMTYTDKLPQIMSAPGGPVVERLRGVQGLWVPFPARSCALDKCL